MHTNLTKWSLFAVSTESLCGHIYSPSISVVSIGTGWISPYRSPHAGTSAKQAPFDDYSVMKHWRTRNSSKTKSRNNREGEKRENPKAVRCGKCADRGDSYCKLNPSPVPCMTTRSCWDRSVLLTYPASLRGLLNPQLLSAGQWCSTKT